MCLKLIFDRATLNAKGGIKMEYLLSKFSHELRNPLTTVYSTIQLIEMQLTVSEGLVEGVILPITPKGAISIKVKPYIFSSQSIRTRISFVCSIHS